MTTVAANNKLYEMVGITDERTDCDCCGRTELKRTIVLKDIAENVFVYFGSVCGAKALTWTEQPSRKVTAQALIKEAEAAERARREAEWKERLNAHPLKLQADALKAPYKFGPGTGRTFLQALEMPGYQETAAAANKLLRQAMDEIGPVYK